MSVGILTLRFDYSNPGRIERASSDPVRLREALDRALEQVFSGEDAGIVTGSDFIVRELNARILLHALPEDLRGELMTRFGIVRTIAPEHVRALGIEQNKDGILEAPDLDREIVRLNNLCERAWLAWHDCRIEKERS